MFTLNLLLTANNIRHNSPIKSPRNRTKLENSSNFSNRSVVWMQPFRSFGGKRRVSVLVCPLGARTHHKTNLHGLNLMLDEVKSQCNSDPPGRQDSYTIRVPLDCLIPGRMEESNIVLNTVLESFRDSCKSLLSGLPLSTSRPLQVIQNAAAQLFFHLLKFSHFTPWLHSLHWLPVAALIRFNTLMLASKAKNGSSPPYLIALTKPYAAPGSRWSSSTAQLVPPRFFSR